MICIYTGPKQEVNAVLCEIEKEDDVEPPRKKAKKDSDKENKSKPKQASKPKKGTQQRRKRGETKASGAIIIVGAADKLDGCEQQNRSSNTSPPLPTGDDGKQKTKSTPLLASCVPLPPTHPPPFNSLPNNDLSFSSMSSLSPSLDDKELNSSYENNMSDSGEQNLKKMSCSCT